MSNVPDFCCQQLNSSGHRNHQSYYTIPPTRSEGAKAPLPPPPSRLVTTRRSLRCSSKSLLDSCDSLVVTHARVDKQYAWASVNPQPRTSGTIPPDEP